MARTQKDVVNYFPHDANACAGDTLTVLQSRFGNDGYAFWFKLLEKLASADGHYIDCRNSTKWQLLLAKTGVDETTGVEIMKLLVEMQAIDKDLWNSKLIWCQKLVENLAIVYSSRHREPPKRPITTGDNGINTGRNCIICGRNIVDMREDAKYCSNACRQRAYRVTAICNAEMGKNGITTRKKPITTDNKAITTGGNTQSKVNKSRVYKNIYIPYPEYPNVNKMTKEEYQKLIEKFGEAGARDRVENLSLYIASKGDKYKNHYATILAWDKKDKKGGQGGAYRGNLEKRRLPDTYRSPEEIFGDKGG